LFLQCNAKVCCMADFNFDYMHSLIPDNVEDFSPHTQPGNEAISCTYFLSIVTL